MTTIRATCPTCGEVGLTPEDIELRVDDADGNAASFYAFTCPTCIDRVCKPADERIVRLLVSGGVDALPLVRLRPSIRTDGPPISHDDLIDFHQLLKTDRWFDQLLGTVRTG
jgi:hypothetical protein